MESLTRGVISETASEALRCTISATALRVERFIAVGRIPFYLAILVRYVAAETVTVCRTISVLPLVFGILFSAYVIVRVKQAPRGQTLWWASIAFDTIAADFSLSDNVWHPTAEYAGLLQMPETAGVLISTVASGLRLSVWAAIWGGALNASGILLLVSADRWLWSASVDTSAFGLSIYLIFIGAMTILAIIVAATSRRLVTDGAVVALRAHDAERGLGLALADCHDARSILTSVQLNAEMVHRAAARLACEPQLDDIRRAAGNLLEDLSQVHRLVRSVNTRAMTQLASGGSPEVVRIAPVIERAVAQIERRFEGISFWVMPISTDRCVLVAGGELALHRVLLNLLTNACEGDGHVTPTQVEVEVLTEPHTDRLLLRVTDNGPGLPHDPLERAKTTGLGVGLSVVRGITEASGGRFYLGARSESGVVACASFPRAVARCHRKSFI